VQNPAFPNQTFSGAHVINKEFASYLITNHCLVESARITDFQITYAIGLPNLLTNLKVTDNNGVALGSIITNPAPTSNIASSFSIAPNSTVEVNMYADLSANTYPITTDTAFLPTAVSVTSGTNLTPSSVAAGQQLWFH
jgi:hypothetical protein